MTVKKPRYRRILLKLSGEALMGEKSFGIDPAVLKTVAKEVCGLHEQGIEIAIVVGGGNIFRGLNSSEYGMGRVSADHMGMLATVINAIALGEALNHLGTPARTMSAVEMNQIAEPYIRAKALSHLEKGRVLLLGGGTGNPYFTTDTTASLRAMEIGAEIILKATKVDGIYDSDPMLNKRAHRYDELNYLDVLKKQIKVMDATAISLCMDHKIPIIVFSLKKKGNIKRVVLGEKVGTKVRG